MVEAKTSIGIIGFEWSGGSLTRVELKPRMASLRKPANAEERTIARALASRISGADCRTSLSLALGDASSFRRRVLTRCIAIPRGEVVTYAELARRAGKPRAARAVGRVMATNPLPIVIPCHRVVASDGSLHGFGGGLEMKRKLLELEGVEFDGAKVRRPGAREVRMTKYE